MASWAFEPEEDSVIVEELLTTFGKMLFAGKHNDDSSEACSLVSHLMIAHLQERSLSLEMF